VQPPILASSACRRQDRSTALHGNADRAGVAVAGVVAPRVTGVHRVRSAPGGRGGIHPRRQGHAVACHDLASRRASLRSARRVPPLVRWHRLCHRVMRWRLGSGAGALEGAELQEAAF